MKITVKQLKQLIKEAIETSEVQPKPKDLSRRFKDYINFVVKNHIDEFEQGEVVTLNLASVARKLGSSSSEISILLDKMGERYDDMAFYVHARLEDNELIVSDPWNV